MANQNYPELMQQPQHVPYPEAQPQMMQAPMLPPMFHETVIAGPNGEPISVVVDPNGQIVPPEIVQQMLSQQMMSQQLNGHMMAPQMMMGSQSECNSVITDVTYRSGAPLISNQVQGF